jgi:hypothetical protein
VSKVTPRILSVVTGPGSRGSARACPVNAQPEKSVLETTCPVSRRDIAEDIAPASAARIVGGEQKAAGVETALPDSLDGPDPRNRADGHPAAQPSRWRGRSEQLSFIQVGCEARKLSTAVAGEAFFLDFPLYN